MINIKRRIGQDGKLEMDNRKLIFLDIDGTLVNDDKVIPEANRQALQEAREAGHIVILASGRMINSVMAQARKLGFTDEGCYVVGYNGAIAVNMHTDEVLFSKPIPKEDVEPLLEVAREMELHGQTYQGDLVITEKDDEEIQTYSRILNVDYKVVEDAAGYLTEDPHKCLFIDLQSREKLFAFRERTASYCEAKGLQTFFSDDHYLDVVREGVSKGSAIGFMCDLLGIAPENTVAAGDAENDIAMIEAAAVGCAVRNATELVKEAADYVTEADNNEGAVAEIIRKFVL